MARWRGMAARSWHRSVGRQFLVDAARCGAVMMVGMMTPAAAPMILIYARVGRQAAARGKPFAPAGWFALGYFLAWTGFAAAATAAAMGARAGAAADRR